MNLARPTAGDAWAGPMGLDDSLFLAEGVNQATDAYVYTTRDLAVDLASPLVAYKVVSTALLKQELPSWLDAIILLSAVGAAWVVVTGFDGIDAYLQ